MNWNKLRKWKVLRGYKSVSEEYVRLVSFINESESLQESEQSFDGAKIKRSKKDFSKLRDRLFKAKTKEIRKDLYKTENEKNKRDWEKSS